MFKKYLIHNLILTLILIFAGVFIYSSLLTEYYNHFIPITIIVTLIINIIGYRLAMGKASQQNKIMMLLVQTFAIRFFTYIALVAVFIYIYDSRSIRLSYIAALFIIYLSYTILEVSSVLKLLRTGNTGQVA